MPSHRESGESILKHKVYVVGIGPGAGEMMTVEAGRILEECEVIVGYPVYLDLLRERFSGREFLSAPMRQEVKRCHLAFQEAKKGKKTAVVCSGDAGIYGLASLMYEIGREYPDCEVEVIPGVTAASSGAALLGAPLNHDFCVISLSDLLTPWELIEKRLLHAAQGDFCIAIYNPASRRRADYLHRACEILLGVLEEERACGLVENIGRKGTSVRLCTLKELSTIQVNMFTTVFIGNSQSVFIGDRLVTTRGYPK